MSTIHLISQKGSSSGLPHYLQDALESVGQRVMFLDARSHVLPRLYVLLCSFHHKKKVWSHRRSMMETYSVAAWKRNTRLNGLLLDRAFRPGDKVLQVGGLYAPHPRSADKEYYLFFTYTMKLAFSDGFSKWIPEPHERDGFVKLEKDLYLKARHIFSASDFLRYHLITEYGVAPENITTVGMGVDDFFVRNIRRTIPASPAKRCIFVGYTFELKGGPDVLKAFSIARQSVPGLELVIIGADHTNEMDQEGVLYVGPVSDRETLLAYYRSADLFLLPSRCDSFGFVFLEAMTQGLICVGSRMNAMPEIIAEGETGYLVEPGDFEGLAEVIIRCYQRPELRVEMGRRAADRVVEKFSWPRVVAEMQSVMFQPEVSSGTASSFDTCSMSRPGEGPFLAVHRERGN